MKTTSTPGIALIGTGPGVGKSVVSYALLRLLARQGVAVGYFKPVSVYGPDDADPRVIHRPDLDVVPIAHDPALTYPIVVQAHDPRITFDHFNWVYRSTISYRNGTAVRSEDLEDDAVAIRRRIREGLTALPASVFYVMEGSGSAIESGKVGYECNFGMILAARIPWLLLTDGQAGAPIARALNIWEHAEDEIRALCRGLLISRSIGIVSDHAHEDEWVRRTGTTVIGSMSAFGYDHDPSIRDAMRTLSQQKDEPSRRAWLDLVADSFERGLRVDLDHLLGGAQGQIGEKDEVARV
jgi:hypothetical protein